MSCELPAKRKFDDVSEDDESTATDETWTPSEEEKDDGTPVVNTMSRRSSQREVLPLHETDDAALDKADEEVDNESDFSTTTDEEVDDEDYDEVSLTHPIIICFWS